MPTKQDTPEQLAELSKNALKDASPEKGKTGDAGLSRCFSENLTRLRKAAGLTQAELAGRLNYSDKSVSKWERGEGLPDLPTAAALAALFGVTVDTLLQETSAEERLADAKKDTSSEKRRRIYIHGLASLLPFLISATAFAVLQIVGVSFGGELALLLFFLYALTAGGIVSTVFSCLWWGRLPKILSVSTVCWGVALSFWLSLRQFAVEAVTIFAAAAVMQVLTVLWFMMPRRREKKPEGAPGKK